MFKNDDGSFQGFHPFLELSITQRIVGLPCIADGRKPLKEIGELYSGMQKFPHD